MLWSASVTWTSIELLLLNRVWLVSCIYIYMYYLVYYIYNDPLIVLYITIIHFN